MNDEQDETGQPGLRFNSDSTEEPMSLKKLIIGVLACLAISVGFIIWHLATQP
jgi:hypothetical protein